MDYKILGVVIRLVQQGFQVHVAWTLPTMGNGWRVTYDLFSTLPTPDEIFQVARLGWSSSVDSATALFHFLPPEHVES